jgi:hypothetical protein
MYSLQQACGNPEIIMISEGYPDDRYLLIENRQPCRFDAKTQQGGLSIFHIDENKRKSDVVGIPWSSRMAHTRKPL